MKPEVSAIIDKLHPFELKILPFLKDGKTLDELSEESGLKKIEAMRAMQWLGNKGVLNVKSDEKKFIGIDSNGAIYLKEGFPEKRFLGILKNSDATFQDAKKKAGMSDEEFNVCLGMLKGKAAIEVSGGRIRITEHGKSLLGKQAFEEKFLKKIEEGLLDEDSLAPEEKFSYAMLKKRKDVVKEVIVKIKSVELTALGRELIKENVEEKANVVDRLTADMIKKGSWKKKDFRKYDLSINVPKICGGKAHFVNQATYSIKRIWLDMGFKEMKGPMLDTSFWNFDALFTAQDHPVRELQDTFYIKDPEKGSLPDKALVNAVKNAHENGGNTGSTGWGYKWSEEEARKNVLRTHTTVLSAKTISRLKKEDLPAKFFSIAKCFRNEALDWGHLFELHQIEGIVIDPDANLRNLLGYLREFFTKLGYEKVRIRPAYFPYTEPSAEVEVFHPVRKEWIELAGAGIFRPEVVVPLLGKDVPVLAWGMGLERCIKDFFCIPDIRQLYSNDLKQLKEIKVWRD